MEKRIIPIIIAAMAIIIVGMGLLVYLQLRPDPSADFVAGVGETSTGAAIDSGARFEIVKLQGELGDLRDELEQMKERISALEARPVASPQTNTQTPQTTGDTGSAPIGDNPNADIDYAQVVLIGERRRLNEGLQIASPTYLESVFGRPRAVLSDNCEGLQNERLRDKLVLEDVGPIRVRMLKPAADSMRRVFDRIKEVDPDLYERIDTAGSLCVRQIRGSNQRASTHSFGLSVDLNIDGQLDRFADGKTQLGLIIMADFFHEEGWYWGAGFGREDSMHFEASRTQVERWIAEGLL
ncbi:MAG: M15 family metallopeptidase [Rhizobiaceae bacterium]